MNFISLLPKNRDFATRLWRDSQTTSGVRFAIREPSLQRRLELTRALQELTRRTEFLAAAGGPANEMELALTNLEVQKLLIEWGLAAIEGLTIDGVAADSRLLIEAGPEALAAEIAEAIRARCELSEEERKN